VMDFGIALLQGARRVTWGPMSSQVGTPDYMAPEQIQGSRGDARTDVYALGMILYEYITGRLPYLGDNPLAIMNQHVNAKPPAIHTFRHDVAPGLEEVIMKALRRRPEDRWQDMQSFVDALKDWKSADVEGLKAERESEPDSANAAKAASFLNIPMSKQSMIVALVFILFFAALVVAICLFGQHPHHR
jgi:eukaryotic-like serine/threonine-protein kinase